MILRKAMAFIRRDFLMATSYKTSFAFQMAGLLMAVPMFFFVGEGVAGATDRFVDEGGNYFAYLLIGLGLLGYHAISLRTFSANIRESQMMGTLEIVLTSPTSLATVLLLSSLWVYIFVTIRFIVYVLVGTAFGLSLAEANLPAAVLILILAIPGFAAFGIASAALIVVIKRGNFVATIMSSASLFLGGVLFPVTVLPTWIQPVSRLLPITYALEGMRGALFRGAGLDDLLPQVAALLVFAAVGLPLSLAMFWLGVRRTKVTGTLAQY